MAPSLFAGGSSLGATSRFAHFVYLPQIWRRKFVHYYHLTFARICGIIMVQ